MKILGVDIGVTDERSGMPINVGFQTQAAQISELTRIITISAITMLHQIGLSGAEEEIEVTK